MSISTQFMLFLHLDTIFGIGMGLLKMSCLYPGILSNQRQRKKPCLCLMADLWTICSPRFLFNIVFFFCFEHQLNDLFVT